MGVMCVSQEQRALLDSSVAGEQAKQAMMQRVHREQMALFQRSKGVPEQQALINRAAAIIPCVMPHFAAVERK